MQTELNDLDQKPQAAPGEYLPITLQLTERQRRIAELEPIAEKLWKEMEEVENKYKEIRGKWCEAHREREHLKTLENARQEVLLELGKETRPAQ